MDDQFITQEDIDKFKPFETEDYNTESNLYISGDNLYKIFLNNFILLPTKEKLINHLLINPLRCKNIISPKARLYKDNIFCGFVMRYVRNSKSISKYTEDDSIDIDKRINYIYSLDSALNHLHKKNIVYGDIHQGNIILTDKDAFLVDIDSIKINEISDELRPLFHLKDFNRDIAIKNETKNTDIIKMNLMYLSLLYHCDFETLYLKTGLKFIRDVVSVLKLPRYIKEEIINNLTLGKDNTYIDDKLGNINNYEKKLILSDENQLRKLIKSKIKI